MTGPVLIYADNAGLLAADLRAWCPGESVHAVDRPEALPETLETHRPEVVFSINSPTLGGRSHRPILDAPSVRWLHVSGSGYEHVLGWDARRITVTNCAGVLAPFLAETVIGALTALNCGLVRYHTQQRERIWRMRALGSTFRRPRIRRRSSGLTAPSTRSAIASATSLWSEKMSVSVPSNISPQMSFSRSPSTKFTVMRTSSPDRMTEPVTSRSTPKSLAI